MGRVRLVALSLILAAACGVASLAAWVFHEYFRAGPATVERTVVIPRGASVAAIADRLAAADVIRATIPFRVAIRVSGVGTGLKAGEYVFPAAVSVRDAIEILVQGRTVVRRITVAEGLTTDQVLSLVAVAEGLDGTVGPPPEEGRLLPETYYYSYGDSRSRLVARMAEAMDEAVEELWAKRAPGLVLESPREAVILASIVEKETSLPEERPRVAAVFLNRLALGMPLQADPTVSYALNLDGIGGDRPLTRADLEYPSPFNTYLVAGLPPAPIANPGRASLAAVMTPIESDELYFVANGSGGHSFARTLPEHLQNVEKWRRLQGR